MESIGQSNTQAIPRSVIPPNGEMILHGITDHFMPTIAKCSLGGWIVVVQGKGIASFTTLDEAMKFVGDAAHDYMGEAPREAIPDGIKPDTEEYNVTHLDTRRGLSVGGVVASLSAAIALIMSSLQARLW